MDVLIASHKDELLSLARQYGVGALFVFGSRARGDADAGSDVDLLIDNAAQLTGFEMGAMEMDAQDILRRKVDLLTTKALHPLMRERVLKEAVRLA